jgi:hypothetical protein
MHPIGHEARICTIFRGARAAPAHSGIAGPAGNTNAAAASPGKT